MKFLDLIGGAFKWFVSMLIALGTAYFTVEKWVDDKVHAAESRVLERVGSMRREDMAVINAIKDDTRIIKETLIRRK